MLAKSTAFIDQMANNLDPAVTRRRLKDHDDNEKDKLNKKLLANVDKI